LKRLSTKLEKVNSNFKDATDCYEHEIKDIKEKVKAEVQKSSKLTKALEGFETPASASQLDAPFVCVKSSIRSKQCQEMRIILPTIFQRRLSSLKRESMTLTKLWWGIAIFAL
jgi:hypothetical protein